MDRLLQSDDCEQSKEASSRELRRQRTAVRYGRICFCVAIPLAIIAFLDVGCSDEAGNAPEPAEKHCGGTPVDPKATYETCKLYQNLKSKLDGKVMFGHQDTLAEGATWDPEDEDFFDEDERSDIYDMVKDYPAVYGWDVGWAKDWDKTGNVDGVPFDAIKRWTILAYQQGGVNTFSMHLNNPVTRKYKSCFDNTPAVPSILPGQELHEKYLEYLDFIAAFLKDLKDDDGTFVPIILRPYHEYNQEWPWWGTSACTDEEFDALWKMTIRYFRDTHDIHHVLYAISPQDATTESAYLERYPGDDWVDILGLDWYNLKDESGSSQWLGKTLSMVAKIAETKDKRCALTEVGSHETQISDEHWWTNRLLPALIYDDYSKRMAWLLVWRNAREERHFSAYKGHESEADFKEFYKRSETVFEAQAREIGMYSD